MSHEGDGHCTLFHDDGHYDRLLRGGVNGTEVVSQVNQCTGGHGDITRVPFASLSVHFAKQGGHNVLVRGARPTEQVVGAGRFARVTCLMAIAIHFDQLISEGEIEDFAEIARLENVSRARVTQILSLRLLAPDIQESLSRLPRVNAGHDPFSLKGVHSIAFESDWKIRRRMLREIFNSVRIRLISHASFSRLN